MIELHNWAGNYRYNAEALHRPVTVADLRSIVRNSRKIRVLGTRHSFNGIADSDRELVSLADLPQRIEVNREAMRVTVSAGLRYGELCRELHRHGLSIPNLASLPHISVAGAVATATHGSGDRNGCLATAVIGIELVTADGEIATITRESDPVRLNGTVVSLGALGVVTALTLQAAPAFSVEQNVYRGLPMTALESDFDAITSSAYSVSQFTNWQSDLIDQVWLKRTTDDPPPRDFFGASPASGPTHPIPSLPAENCTEQMGVPGPWHERLPHFRLEYTPSAGEELQSEYLVPRGFAVEAMQAVRSIAADLRPLLLVSEVRTIAADEFWMSPFYRRDCIGIHFTWVKDWPSVQQLLPLLEEKLAPFDARPHWGKLFTMRAADLLRLYPRLNDFRQLAAELDPAGKFRNTFLNSTLFA